MGDSAPHKALRLIGTGLVILLPVVLALWFAQLRAKAETIDQLHSFSQLALQKTEMVIREADQARAKASQYRGELCSADHQRYLLHIVRGLLYVPVRDRSKAAGKIEFAVWAEDAAKVNRVLEKMGVDYLQADTGAKAEVGPMPAAEQQAAVQTEVVEMPEGRIAFEVTELDDAFNVGGNFTQRTGPDMPAAEKSPSAPSSPQRSSTQPQPEKSAERIRAEGGRPSVKQELGELKREQARKKAAERRPPQRRRPPKNRKKQKGR
mgnify:CR=1 FL=1